MNEDNYGKCHKNLQPLWVIENLIKINEEVYQSIRIYR